MIILLPNSLVRTRASRSFFPTARSVRSGAAFTLVELLIVVMIIAILAALLLPAISSYIERAQGAVCAGNMRSVGAALMAYRGDHNGWFPPGHPKHPKDSALNFSTVLVPDYLTEMPVCPGARKKLTPTQQKTYGSSKRYFQAFGGGYAINDVLSQVKLESRKEPLFHLPFVLEMYSGSSTWAMSPHQNTVLKGSESASTLPRSHGKGDILNFMFADGHIEAISRNDTRDDIEEEDKAWIIESGNPNGKFSQTGKNDLHYSTTQLSVHSFEVLYPNLAK